MTIHDDSSATKGKGGATPAVHESRQLQVVERLADGFALEMNNVLAAIIGRASVLEAELDINSPGHRDVQAILAAGRLALDLTRNLLDFSRHYKLQKEQLSLNEVVGKVTSLWERSIKQDVELQLELDPELDDVEGDATRLKQMLIQLGVNAIDAMPVGGQLKFATKNVLVEQSQPAAAAFSGLSPGKYVRLQVSDTGEGMDAETVSKAFEPFFTTKPTNVSAGLGLAQVYDTTKRHNGEVRIFSKKGLGTTVTLYFPAAGAAAAHRSAPTIPEGRPSDASLTILLVDDDLHVLEAGGRLLSKLGYRVLSALEGSEALELYGKRREEVSLAIVDLVMPMMDGTKLMGELRALTADLPVIVCSGYSNQESKTEALSHGASGFLTKPYTLAQLSTAVTKALEKTA